ncbi:hypothetical protein [Nocardia sp. NPDC050718]|uniref:hypothetical protein n=1 Tax=Nocardia sp. NPDC050718 TaxID=3155788 RepID=UPI00340B3F44
MSVPDVRSEYYHPNHDKGFEPTPLTPTPMTYERPWTHPDDITVCLSRCQERLPNNGEGSPWLKHALRPLSVEPLELEIAQPLPDVCPRHGRPAVSRTPVRALFYDTSTHPRFHNQAVVRELVRAPWRTLVGAYTPARVSTIVAGTWPVCDRCVRASELYRKIARLLLWLTAANIIALILVSVANIDALVPLLALALFPGSLPGLLMIAVLLQKKTVRTVRFRPIYDERFAFIQAHPNFSQALEQDLRVHPTSPEQCP